MEPVHFNNPEPMSPQGITVAAMLIRCLCYLYKIIILYNYYSVKLQQLPNSWWILYIFQLLYLCNESNLLSSICFFYTMD